MDESTKALIRLEAQVENLEKEVHRISEALVTKKEFDPVRNVVFSAVAVILMAVLGALIAMVVAQ